ncbi:MAG TPA: DUF5723 family protein, partial [Longimicrobiales bacterium]|nr:DUF5723 family protein [Longimicrobiales bacterium]
KQQWLNAIREEGSQAGTGGSDVTWLAVQIGPVGVHASSSARAVNNISPGVAQLVLFGNTDEQGNPEAIDLAGSSLDVNAYSTVGVSFGLPFTLGDGASRLAIGATAKYTMGHLLALGQESTGTTTTAPIGVNFSFPIVHTPLGGEDEPFEVNSGTGIGLDIGVGYESGALRLGAAVQNVVNTFAWDESLLRYRAATMSLAQSDYTTDFASQPVASAPAALRAAVTDMKFKPSFAVGAALRQSENLSIAADARFGSAAGMNTRPPTHIGAGVEYVVGGFLPVRVGAAFVKLDAENSGLQYGAGIGLRLSAINLSASVGQRSTDIGKDTMLMVSVVSIGM